MRWMLIPAIVAIALAALAPRAVAQHSYTKAEIENGWRLYQGSCAVCHGSNGDAVRGVALLSGRFQRAATDDELMRIMQRGIPGTPMPPNNYSDIEAGMIVAYLRGVAAGESVPSVSGDAGRGKTIFEGKGNCLTCHNQTSRTAPSLAAVGALRLPLELERSLVDPAAELHPDFRSVRVVTKNGTVVTGRLLNQSTFSVQLLDSGERLRGFDKSDLREVEVLKTSLMPSYKAKLDAQEISDVVTYLSTLRGQR